LEPWPGVGLVLTSLKTMGALSDQPFAPGELDG
jgi:hypothetical protein